MFKHSNPCREGFFPKKGLKKIYFSGSHILLPFEKPKMNNMLFIFGFCLCFGFATEGRQFFHVGSTLKRDPTMRGEKERKSFGWISPKLN